MAKELTGGKVLFITVSAFGVIIAVNVVMAVQAVRTFPGLEVENSYVASQTFDTERAAQEALGWQVKAAIEDSVLTFAIRDGDGLAVRLASLDATLGRPTEMRDDTMPDFRFVGGDYVAPVSLAPGYWDLRVEATAPNGTYFHQRIDLYVK